MPARNFCDTCDRLIVDDEPYYSIVIERKANALTHNVPKDTYTFNKREYGYEVHHLMVCRQCTLTVTMAANNHKQSPSIRK